MVRFECDYAAGAHPKVLQALVDTNLEEHPGYGTDPHCDRARALLRDLCQAPDAHIHFLVGGTQANTTVISAAPVSYTHLDVYKRQAQELRYSPRCPPK